eukprot:TRINITY_DN3630_c0_g1_i1.p1 TRINITY_DN3630_c0_g1~~TRINITY_DN3630_c0_g1_i1.p1  ORF type:complete len:503 (+),score=124.74 TRINITY_DN3630_c0_g1_i1:25-1509(+)
MNTGTRALLGALQRQEPASVVKPLITPETARTPDNYYELRPLFWALSYGADAAVLSALLSAYPEAANEKHPTEGWTPLHYAEKLGAEAVKLLIERCPGAAKEPDAEGSLPLHWAAEHNASPEVVKLLLQANREATSCKDAAGRLPARLALDYGASEELIALLRTANPSAFGALPRAAPMPQDVLPVALLFPGQGSQYVSMLKGVQSLPAVRELLSQAQAVLGYDLLKVCLDGPESTLQDTLHCYPALYVAGMAALEKLRVDRPEAAAKFQAVAGFSLGECTALAAAGVFSFADGLELVLERAKALQEVSNLRAQAMVSLAGLEEPKVLDLCCKAMQASGADEVCRITSYAFKKGFIVGGTLRAVEEFQKLAKASKALQVRLVQGEGALHTELMTAGRLRYEAKLQELLPKMSRPRCKVYMNATGRPIDWSTEPEAIVKLMSQQLTSPVRWKESMDAMISLGLEEIYECGPNKQLKAMMKRIDNDAWSQTTNIEV